ncbi:MAG: hypothetical protein WBA12_02000, partial [Catalinimonas sp.]
MKRLSTLFGLLLLTLASARAQDYELVADINQDGSVWFLFGSELNHFTDFKGELYFTAKAPRTGRELYRYDGTRHELVVDLNPNVGAQGAAQDGFSRAQGLTVVGDKLYFMGTDGTRGDTLNLYAYDGETDPVMVTSLDVDGQTFTSILFELGGQLYFTKRGRVFNNAVSELWTYNGIDAPTLVPMGSDAPRARTYQFEALEDTVYMWRNESNHNVWKYGGSGVPKPVTALDGFFGSQMTLYDGKVYFAGATSPAINDRELWAWDRAAGTVELVEDIRPGDFSSNPNGLYVHDGVLYFSADDGTAGRELWSYDGTQTTLLDLNPGDERASSFPSGFVTYEGAL